MTYFANCLVSDFVAFLAQTCPENWGQLLGFAAQKISPLGVNAFAAGNPITAEASWNAFAAGTPTASSTIVYSPFVVDGAIPGSEGNFTGGNDNSTVLGIRRYNGENNIEGVPLKMENLGKTTREALKQLTKESVLPGTTNLQFYFFFENGIVAQEGAAVTDHTGIPVYNFRVPSVDSQGFNAQISTNPTMDLAADWSDTAVLIEKKDIDFDPLTKLFKLAS